MTRGGARPGAGAKPKPEGTKVRRFLIALSPEAAAKWEAVTPGERSAMVERMLLSDKAKQEKHPPCVICGGENDIADICQKCADEYFKLPAWAQQDYQAARQDAATP